MPLVIDLRKCVEQPLRINETLDVAALFTSYKEFEAISSVAIVMEISAVGAGQFLVRGSVQGDSRPFCGRCLEPFSCRLERKFQLRYLPKPVGGKRDGEIDDEDSAFYGDDHELRVDELVEEQLNLAFPMRFLCSENCLGLCAQCGTDRNRLKCECPTELRASPFADLKVLAETKTRPV